MSLLRNLTTLHMKGYRGWLSSWYETHHIYNLLILKDIRVQEYIKGINYHLRFCTGEVQLRSLGNDFIMINTSTFMFSRYTQKPLLHRFFKSYSKLLKYYDLFLRTIIYFYISKRSILFNSHMEDFLLSKVSLKRDFQLKKVLRKTLKLKNKKFKIKLNENNLHSKQNINILTDHNYSSLLPIKNLKFFIFKNLITFLKRCKYQFKELAVYEAWMRIPKKKREKCLKQFSIRPKRNIKFKSDKDTFNYPMNRFNKKKKNQFFIIKNHFINKNLNIINQLNQNNFYIKQLIIKQNKQRKKSLRLFIIQLNNFLLYYFNLSLLEILKSKKSFFFRKKQFKKDNHLNKNKMLVQNKKKFVIKGNKKILLYKLKVFKRNNNKPNLYSRKIRKLQKLYKLRKLQKLRLKIRKFYNKRPFRINKLRMAARSRRIKSQKRLEDNVVWGDLYFISNSIKKPSYKWFIRRVSHLFHDFLWQNKKLKKKKPITITMQKNKRKMTIFPQEMKKTYTFFHSLFIDWLKVKIYLWYYLITEIHIISMIYKIPFLLKNKRISIPQTYLSLCSIPHTIYKDKSISSTFFFFQISIPKRIIHKKQLMGIKPRIYKYLNLMMLNHLNLKISLSLSKYIGLNVLFLTYYKRKKYPIFYDAKIIGEYIKFQLMKKRKIASIPRVMRIISKLHDQQIKAYKKKAGLLRFRIMRRIVRFLNMQIVARVRNLFYINKKESSFNSRTLIFFKMNRKKLIRLRSKLRSKWARFLGNSIKKIYPIIGLRIEITGPPKKAKMSKTFSYINWVKSDLLYGAMPHAKIHADVSYWQHYARVKRSGLGLKIWIHNQSDLYDPISYKLKVEKQKSHDIY